jgi:hypothetical protein
MLIRTGDTVEVRSGNSRGTRARVLSVDSASGKLVVEGVNRVYRHIKRSQKNPQGGRLSKRCQSMHQMFCFSVRLAGRRRGLVFLWPMDQRNGSAGSVAVSKARLAGRRASDCSWLDIVVY